MEAFVKAIVEKKDGKSITLEYNTWAEHPIYEDEDFNPSQTFLDNMINGEQLVDAMREWFLEALDHSSRAMDLVEDIGAEIELRKLLRKDMKRIEISSLLDCEWEVYGSDITYDFDTKKKKRKSTGGKTGI